MRSIALLAAIPLLVATPVAAQLGTCDSGRGALMPDLGFARLRVAPAAEAAMTEISPPMVSEPLVRRIRPNGPAAGLLQEGDVVVAIDGAPITSPEGAARYYGIRPGDRVRLSIRRDGSPSDVGITAAAVCVPFPPAPPAPPASPAPPAPPSPSGELMPASWLGLTIDCNDCGDDAATGGFRFRRPPVVVGVAPGSPAAQAGIRPGDLITHVDGVAITDARAWAHLTALRPEHQVRFQMQRSGSAFPALTRALPQRH